MADHPLAEEFLLKMLPRNDTGDPVIGGMHLQSRLGSGAMGAVFKGHHPRLNVLVAVKILAPNQGSKENNERAARWFQREAQLLWQVQSTNVVRVSDVGVDEQTGLQYMVMDYVRGMTAADFVEHYNNFMLQPTSTVEVVDGDEAAPTWQNGLDETIAVRICLAAARGLEAIHEKNIIHRDIKPDNILIPYRADYTKDFDITQLDFDKTQLVDLGVARQSADSATTQQGLIVGTPAFMAPEQAQGEDPVKASDVYSLGATLYYLLAGRAPFMGKSHAVVVKVVTEAPPPIEQLVPRLANLTRELIAKCMEKSAAKRFADGRELRRALERVSAELPTQPGELGMFTLPALSAVAKAVNPDAPTGGGTAPTAAGQPGTAKHNPVKVTAGPRTSGQKLPSAPSDAAAPGVAAAAVLGRRTTGPQKPVAAAQPKPSTGAAAKPATGAQAKVPAKGKTRKVGPPTGSQPTPIAETPNYLPSDEDPRKKEREALQAAEKGQQRMEEVYATWAAIPPAAWGGLTAAGCFYHAQWLLGFLMTILTVGACALPFLMQGRFRRIGVVLGGAVSLGGYWLLDGVGGILTEGLARVWGTDRARAAGESVTVNDWLSTIALTLVGLMMCGVWYYLTRYFMDEKKRQQLAAERLRLGAEKS